jgi:glycosyltransferase involved in cell wall biosynthesis
MRHSIIIPTYNRADDLDKTLQSIAGLSPTNAWEVIVVDNNSTDHTRAVVSEASKKFPTELRYVFEGEQGRCAALNAGIRASRGAIILTTDDDVRVESDWLARSAQSLDLHDCDYVCGKVLPIWGAPRPPWLPDRGGRHWAVIALLDYGDAPIELGSRAPLGVNMAFRREAFDRAGLWDNRVGRKAGTLLGQEVREWRLRAKAAGLRGFYSPDMVVHHCIPAERLTRRYFRRWFYWHGVSRAMLYGQSRIDMESPEESTLDFSNARHIGGVPRYLYRRFLKSILDMAQSSARRDAVAAFEHELWLWFFAGIARQRWKDRNKQPQASPAPARHAKAGS